jgi:tRNA threonylcarbamoyladenosine biosynthesis protein TsaB
VKPGLVIGIETSGKSTGLALADSGKVVAEMVEDSSCGHNEVLMPLLDRLFRGAGAKVDELSGIGVDIGPGMFTALRVGTSTAKGLAIVHRIPIIGVSSLWGIARTARPALDRVLSVIDARKQQVYAALYLDGRAAIPPAVMNPEELVSEVRSALPSRTSLVVAGNGAGICADLLTAAEVELELAGIESPSPGVVAIEAGERIEKGLADDLAAIEPLYLRRTDAELTREQKLNPKR